MNRGWKGSKTDSNKGLSMVKIRPDRIRLCKICGGRTEVGSICQSCADYLKRVKATEKRASS